MSVSFLYVLLSSLTLGFKGHEAIMSSYSFY